MVSNGEALWCACNCSLHEGFRIPALYDLVDTGGAIMSTRAVFTFKDNYGEYSVYKHMDGYPSRAGESLKATLDSKKCWDFPRFEADEFAAAFIAANKTEGGNLRLTNRANNHDDLGYNYIITFKDNSLFIQCYIGNKQDRLAVKGSINDLINYK